MFALIAVELVVVFCVIYFGLKTVYFNQNNLRLTDEEKEQVRYDRYLKDKDNRRD